MLGHDKDFMLHSESCCHELVWVNFENDSQSCSFVRVPVCNSIRNCRTIAISADAAQYNIVHVLSLCNFVVGQHSMNTFVV